MGYTLQILAEIEDDLVAIPEPDYSRIDAKILELANNPRPAGVVKIRDHPKIKDLYRIRVGKYRIVYRIRDKELVVIVVGVAPRGDVYPLVKRRTRKWR